MILPASYRWILKEKLPPMVGVALAYFGTREIPGSKSNPIIMRWAKYIGADEYKADSRAWCALFMGAVAKKTGQLIPRNPLRSLHWTGIGYRVKTPKFGDIMIFKENDVDGHIGLYIGEGKTVYHILGGNQSNEVNIVSISKKKFYMARRPKRNKSWLYPNIRKIFLDKFGYVIK